MSCCSIQWRHDFEKILRLKVTDSDFDLLLRQRFSNNLEEHLLDLALPFGQREVVLSKEQLLREWGRRVTLKDIHTREEVVLEDYSRLLDLKDVQLLMRQGSAQNTGKVPGRGAQRHPGAGDKAGRA